MLLVVGGVALPWIAPTAPSPDCETHGVCQDCCPTVRVDRVTGAHERNIPPASIVTMLGGLALIFAHVGNLRCACRTCRSGHGNGRDVHRVS